MEMSNATAAGPSRGLLDIIFGSKDAGEAEADGQGFSSLMNFIKTMNGEKKEEQSAVLGRTLRETPHGKNVVDSNVVGTPGKNAASEAQGQLALARGQEEDQRQKEKLQELSMLLGLSAQANSQAVPLPKQVMEVKQEPIPGLQPEKVNAALKQKELPPLNQEELKLLQAVNSRLEQVQAPKQSETPKALAAGAGAAAVPVEKSSDPRLQQEMAKKGIDPRKLKSVEGSAAPASGTPEKILSTETYLQMHESVGKNSAKEALSKGAQGSAGEAPLPQAVPQGSLTSAAVAETKGLELGSRKERDLEIPENGSKQTKLDASGNAFGAALASQDKSITQRDVFLPGLDKPEQFREVLLGDVGSSVALHAHKGGGEMKLVLHPDDMGEVKLKVSTKDGKVEVQVTAENNDVAKILRGGTQDLEASLKDQNLSLTKFEVSVADPSSVASLENKPSLNEQFLSQNQPQGGYEQGSANEGRNQRWNSDQGNRQGGTYASLTEENERSSPKSASMGQKQAARDHSRRLDVVA